MSYKPNFVNTGQELEKGDKVEASCNACGERFAWVEGEAQSTFFCPDCYGKIQEVKQSMVAGKWRVSDDKVRNKLVRVLREHSQYYSVFVAERVGDVYVYKSKTEVGNE